MQPFNHVVGITTQAADKQICKESTVVSVAWYEQSKIF